jgi:hypothetical protein
VPRKVWILLAAATLAALLYANGSWERLGVLFGRPETFLDAAVSDLRKNPQVDVLNVDRDAGRITVLVKPINRTLILVVTKDDTDLRLYQWEDEEGNIISLERIRGPRTEKVHIAVPGVPGVPGVPP